MIQHLALHLIVHKFQNSMESFEATSMTTPSHDDQVVEYVVIEGSEALAVPHMNDGDILLIYEDSGEHFLEDLSSTSTSAGIKRKYQRPKTSLGFFLQEEKCKSGKFDYTASMAKWKSLYLSEKVKYKIMHGDAKEKLGIQINSVSSGSKSDSKEKKLERDRLRQKEIRRGENQKKIEGRANVEKLKEILYNKEMKLSEMENKTEDLKSELLACDLETHAVEKMLKEKEKLESLLKEKFKMVFKHHSGCNNK